MAQASGYVSPAAATREFRKEAHQLLLPTGAHWPTSPIEGTGPDGAPEHYQAGYGRSAADFAWYCAWAVAALNPSTNRIALETLPKIRQLHYYRVALNARNQHYLDRILVAAKHGHLDKIKRDVALNCG